MEAMIRSSLCLEITSRSRKITNDGNGKKNSAINWSKCISCWETWALKWFTFPESLAGKFRDYEHGTFVARTAVVYLKVVSCLLSLAFLVLMIDSIIDRPSLFSVVLCLFSNADLCPRCDVVQTRRGWRVFCVTAKGRHFEYKLSRQFLYRWLRNTAIWFRSIHVMKNFQNRPAFDVDFHCSTCYSSLWSSSVLSRQLLVGNSTPKVLNSPNDRPKLSQVTAYASARDSDAQLLLYKSLRLLTYWWAQKTVFSTNLPPTSSEDYLFPRSGSEFSFIYPNITL